MTTSIFALEKNADINVKNDFFGDVIEGRIVDEVFKVVPLLKDNSYRFVISNKNDEMGALIGYIDIKVEDEKNKSKLNIKIPVFIKDFKLKPIDSFVLDNIAYPIDDLSIKELLLSPTNFRKLTAKEMKESRILSKLAEEDVDGLETAVNALQSNEFLQDVAKEYGASIESFKQMKKEAQSFNEPITDFIIKRERNGYDFDLYYVKFAFDEESVTDIEFNHTVQTPKSINLLLEAAGYKSLEMQEDLNSGKEVYLKSPMLLPKAASLQAIEFDRDELFKEGSLYAAVDNGACELFDSKGNPVSGFVFDLYDFGSSTNKFPYSKIFIDENKNYALDAMFQGQPVEDSAKMLKEDYPEPGDMGVFIDHSTYSAYGPVTIKSFVDNKSNKLSSQYTVIYSNKSYDVKITDNLQKPIFDSNEVLIPKRFEWISIQKKIDRIQEDPNKTVLASISDASYILEKDLKHKIKLASFSAPKNNISIPSDEHLKIFLNRMNFATNDKDGVTGIYNRLKTPGGKINFTSNMPMAALGNTPIVEKTTMRQDDPEIRTKVLSLVNDNVDAVNRVIPGIYSMMGSTKHADDSTFLENLTKYGAQADTLDSLFSLNIVNDLNSAIFVSNIHKLRFALSFLTALRIYLRFGWEVPVKEFEISEAIEALSSIISGLESYKSKKLLENQLKNSI